MAYSKVIQLTKPAIEAAMDGQAVCSWASRKAAKPLSIAKAREAEQLAGEAVFHANKCQALLRRVCMILDNCEHYPDLPTAA
jgi:hypothetical protein